MKRIPQLLIVGLALVLCAPRAQASDVGAGATVTVGTPMMGVDANGKARFVKGGATVVRLSASGGDTLTTSVPTDGSTQGYALSPAYSAARIAFSDPAATRIVTKWVQDSASGKWRAAGQLTTTIVSGTAGEVVFDQQILVGDGRIYFQIVDAVVTTLKVDFIVQ